MNPVKKIHDTNWEARGELVWHDPYVLMKWIG